MSWDENKLIALQLGDRKAQEQCYIAFSPLLYTTILKICDSREVASDLLHDTFMDVFNNIASFNPQFSFIAWLKRIAINNTFNHIKRQKTALKVIEHIDSTPQSATQSNNNLLNKLLYQLPTEHRMVMWLFIVEQYSHADIAQFTDKSESYSKSIVSRSLKKLRCHAEVKKHGTY